MTYSVHFRKKVLAVKEKEQLSFSAISKKFNIGRNTVFSWTKKLYPQKHRDKKAIKIDRDKLVQDVKEYSDAYQYERAERLGVSRSGIQKALKQLKITYKKSFTTAEGKRRKEIGVSG
ncbi:MAG: transposase [Rickettsiales bacterium]|nr:transposase [Rickettsiales bacterium]